MKTETNNFFWRDKSGRGFTSEVTTNDIYNAENNLDDYDNFLHEWAEAAEIGDSWEDDTNKYICISRVLIDEYPSIIGVRYTPVSDVSLLVMYKAATIEILKNGAYYSFYFDSDKPRFFRTLRSAVEWFVWLVNDKEEQAKEELMVDMLATAFHNALCYELTTDELIEVRELNAVEEDDRICHTHDFVDANVLMYTAFEKVFNREIDLIKDAGLVNMAWDKAVKKI